MSDYNGKSLNASPNPQDITLDSDKQRQKRFVDLRKFLESKKGDISSARKNMNALTQNTGGNSSVDAIVTF